MPKYIIRSEGCTIAEHLYGDKTPDRDLLPGERSVGNLIIPSFQRQPIWSDEQRVRLIDSLMSGLPIGGIIINRLSDYTHECADLLLDGQQRMITIHAFFNDEFEVNNHFFSEFSDTEKIFFKCITIPRAVSELHSIEECQELYQRIAYGGSEHKPHHYLER